MVAEDYRTFHPCLRAPEPYAFSELFREHDGKGGGEGTRTTWWRDVPQKAVFQTRRSHCIHAIAAVVAVYVRPAQSHISAWMGVTTRPHTSRGTVSN